VYGVFFTEIPFNGITNIPPFGHGDPLLGRSSFVSGRVLTGAGINFGKNRNSRVMVAYSSHQPGEARSHP
jgi:hypothetical protein